MAEARSAGRERVTFTTPTRGRCRHSTASRARKRRVECGDDGASVAGGTRAADSSRAERGMSARVRRKRVGRSVGWFISKRRRPTDRERTFRVCCAAWTCSQRSNRISFNVSPAGRGAAVRPRTARAAVLPSGLGTAQALSHRAERRREDHRDHPTRRDVHPGRHVHGSRRRLSGERRGAGAQRAARVRQRGDARSTAGVDRYLLPCSGDLERPASPAGGRNREAVAASRGRKVGICGRSMSCDHVQVTRVRPRLRSAAALRPPGPGTSASDERTRTDARSAG